MSRRFFTVGSLMLAVGGLLAFLLLREANAPPPIALPGAEEESSTSAASAPIEVEAGKTPRAKRGGTAICGMVVLENGGRPAGSAMVAIRGPRGSAILRVGEDGAFCFRDLDPGSHDLAARLGQMRSRTVEGLILDAGEELRDLALVLRGGTWVSGKVADRRTGDGIDGARVLAHCAAGLGLSAAVSRGDGTFTLQGLPQGRHMLTVQAPGYSPSEMVLDLPGSRPLTGVTLILDPVARISGRVEDAGGRPVEGAVVRAAAYRLRDRPEPVQVEGVGSVRSLADGSFEVEAPPGLVSVHAVAAGHGPGRADGLEVGSGGEVEGVRVRLASAAGLLVEVMEVDGRLAVGARVRALCEGNVQCGTGVTDALGRLELGELVAGSVRLEATGANRSGSARISVEVAAGVRRRLSLALSADGVLRGVVVDDRDKPAGGAIVAVFDAMGGGVARTEAGSDGRFHVQVPADVQLDLRAEAHGARGELVGARAGDDLRLVVRVPGSIEGFVTDEAGRPVTDFTVTVIAPGDDLGPGVWRRQRFAAERGDFVFAELPPGGYRLQAAGPGYAAGDEVPIRVWTNDRVGPVHLRVSSAGRIRGRVLSPDGRPVSGARVATEPSRLHGLARWTASAGSAVESDGSGAFVLEDVPAGASRRIYAWHPDWTAAAGGPVRVEPGSLAGPVEVRLRARRGAGHEPEAFGGVGMTIREDPDGVIRVGEVFAGGPAFLAGLRGDDRLLAIDGRPADSLGLQGTLSAIRGPVGSEVRLLIERNNGARFEARMVRVELRM